MFKNERVVVTGGSSGLGKALAERLVRSGAHLALMARSRERLLNAREELSAFCTAGQRIEAFACDVSDPQAVDRTFRAMAETLGTPDVLINNAGILREGRFEDLPLSTFREVMDIDFFGALHCTRAVLPLFRGKGGGRIVNIASLGGRMAAYGYAAYCSSKFALVGLTDTLRAELKSLNIKVHLVCPGEFDSPMIEELNTCRTEENRAVSHIAPVLPLDVVADEVIRGIRRGRYLIIPGSISRFLDLAYRLSPRIARFIIDCRIRGASAQRG